MLRKFGGRFSAYAFCIPLVVAISLPAFITLLTPRTHAASVAWFPGPLNLLAPDNNVVKHHFNLVKNHKYKVSYTMPTLRCFGDNRCDNIEVDWSVPDGSFSESWGTVRASDLTYNAGSIFTAYLQSDATENFFVNDNNGAVDLTILGYCSEADGVTWANCYIPDFQIVDLDAPGETEENLQPQKTEIPGPTDKVAPVISLTTRLEKIVKIFPLVNGRASDDKEVLRVEYSTDGGDNWLPVESARGLGGKQVDFSFKPPNIEDGNYTVLARATDSSGNRSSTQAFKIVVDRLPPIASPPLISIGPLVLGPNKESTIDSQVGVEQKITLSAVGGPTSIALIAQKTVDGRQQTAENSKIFTLTQSPASGLWAGIMSFEEPGLYKLVVQSVDGAGNKTSRQLNSVKVGKTARTLKAGTNQAIEAKLTIYYLEPESEAWVVWDAAAYGQSNPQKADKTGGFGFFLPSGKYYLKAKAAGYRQLTTNIFEINSPRPLSTTLYMSSSWSWKIGSLTLSLPNFSTDRINVENPDIGRALVSQDLTGKATPDFSLGSTNGPKVITVGLLGKPTVMTFLTTWAPTASEQLKALSELQTSLDLNVLPVAIGENSAKLKAYNAISDLELDWLADPDSSLVDDFSPQSLPTHYFIDRKGTVKRVVTDVLSKQEILDILTAL